MSLVFDDGFSQEDEMSTQENEKEKLISELYSVTRGVVEAYPTIADFIIRREEKIHTGALARALDAVNAPDNIKVKFRQIVKVTNEKEEQIRRDEKLKTLENYTKWLLEHEYCDTDVLYEDGGAVGLFLKDESNNNSVEDNKIS